MIEKNYKPYFKTYSREQLLELVELLEEELIAQGWRHLGTLVLFMGGGVVLGWVAHKLWGG